LGRGVGEDGGAGIGKSQRVEEGEEAGWRWRWRGLWGFLGGVVANGMRVRGDEMVW